MTPAQLAEIEKRHPRPWHIGHVSQVMGDWCDIDAANGAFVCDVKIATASLIVAAVNAYKPTEDGK